MIPEPTEVSLAMVAAGEAEFRRRCGDMLSENIAECEAAAIAIYGAMEAAREPEAAAKEIADLKHDLERQMTIANAECNEAERAKFEAGKLREALEDIANSTNSMGCELVRKARTALSRNQGR